MPPLVHSQFRCSLLLQSLLIAKICSFAILWKSIIFQKVVIALWYITPNWEPGELKIGEQGGQRPIFGNSQNHLLLVLYSREKTFFSSKLRGRWTRLFIGNRIFSIYRAEKKTCCLCGRLSTCNPLATKCDACSNQTKRNLWKSFILLVTI